MKNDIMKSGSAQSGVENAPIFLTTGSTRSKRACASGCAASSRRCSRPSWTKCLPVPVMADGLPMPNRAMGGCRVSKQRPGRSGCLGVYRLCRRSLRSLPVHRNRGVAYPVRTTVDVCTCIRTNC